MNGKQNYKIDKVGLAVFIFAVCFMVFIIIATVKVTVDFVKYPEEYVATWKYQLENDLKNGDMDAIEYYNDTYIANGKQLFGDDYIMEDDYLNMAAVVGYDVTEYGLCLYTDDGDEYYIQN